MFREKELPKLDSLRAWFESNG